MLKFNYMRYLFRTFMLLLLPVAVSCGKEEAAPPTPGEIAVNFFSSITSGDVKAVRDNVVFRNAKEEQMFDSYLEKLFIPNVGKQAPRGHDAAYKIVSEEIKNDTAYVQLQANGAADKVVKMKVRLLNAEGVWKVDGSQAVLHRVD